MSLVLPYALTETSGIPEFVLQNVTRDLRVSQSEKDVVHPAAVAADEPVSKQTPELKAKKIEISAVQEVRLWARPVSKDLSVPSLKSLGTPYLRYFVFVDGRCAGMLDFVLDKGGVPEFVRSSFGR